MMNHKTILRYGICLALALCAGLGCWRCSTQAQTAVFIRSTDRGISPRTASEQVRQSIYALQDSSWSKIRTLAEDCGIVLPEKRPFPANGINVPVRGSKVVRALRRIAGKTNDLFVDIARGESDTTLCYTVFRGQNEKIAHRTIRGSELSQATSLLAETICRQADPIAALMNHYAPCAQDSYMESINRMRLYQAADSLTRETPDILPERQEACDDDLNKLKNTILGVVCESFSRATGDTVVLRRAIACYRRAQLDEKASDLVRRIDLRSNEQDATRFIHRFLNDNTRLPDHCRQLILVYNDHPKRVSCVFRRYEKQPDGQWREAARAIRANAGRNGVAPHGEKREGDGRSPSGAYPLGFAFGYRDDVQIAWPFLTVDESYFWISDPDNPAYNQMTRQRPAQGDFEYLRRQDDAYKYAVVVEYNTNPVKKHHGSAIFFHIEKSFDTGSSGCITVTEQAIVETLGWLDPHGAPYILIGTLPDSFSEQ